MKTLLYKIIEVDNENDTKIDEMYSYIMIGAIIISILPLFTREENLVFTVIEYITSTLFIIDYIFRWITADLKLNRGWKSYFLYPFTPFALLDLLTILPVFTTLSQGFKALRTLRAIRCLRVFKTLRYSKSFLMIARVFKKEKYILLTVIGVSIVYTVITALIMYNIEVENFDTYFDSLYWATTALTTVGYGDIYPISTIGKMISMVSSFIGIAIVAIPSGIITAGFVEELNHNKS